MNPVKQKLLAGNPVVGIFVSLNDPRAVEICGHAGFDYVLIDAEHSPFSERECENLVRAAEITGIPAFVRVPANDPKIILRYLDVGLKGVMIPGARSSSDVRAAVHATKYAPVGSRGGSAPRLGNYGNIGFKEWSETANDDTVVIVQLEHRDVIDDLEEVLTIEGVDAFEMGQLDLMQSFGVSTPGEDARVKEYIDRAEKTVLNAGRVLGDTTNDPQEAADLLQRGYGMVACNMSRILMQSSMDFVSRALISQAP